MVQKIKKRSDYFLNTGEYMSFIDQLIWSLIGLFAIYKIGDFANKIWSSLDTIKQELFEIRRNSNIRSM